MAGPLVRALEAAGAEVRDEGDLPVAMYRAAVADPRQRDPGPALLRRRRRPVDPGDHTQLGRLVDGLVAALAQRAPAAAG